MRRMVQPSQVPFQGESQCPLGETGRQMAQLAARETLAFKTAWGGDTLEASSSRISSRNHAASTWGTRKRYHLLCEGGSGRHKESIYGDDVLRAPLQPTPEGCYVSGAPFQRKRNADAGCYLQTRGKLRGEPTWGHVSPPLGGVARTRASDAPSAPSYKEKECISYVESCVPAKSLFRTEWGVAFLNFNAAHRMPASVKSIIQNRWIPSALGAEFQTFVR